MLRLEGLGKLKKKSNVLIGNRTRDLPAYSIVHQPTTLPRDPIIIISCSSSSIDPINFVTVRVNLK
jgi:hypothetical protein